VAVLGHTGGYAHEGGGRRFGSGKAALTPYGLLMRKPGERFFQYVRPDEPARQNREHDE